MGAAYKYDQRDHQRIVHQLAEDGQRGKTQYCHDRGQRGAGFLFFPVTEHDRKPR